ncbi:MAG: polysaccharide deacetylase family protein [Chitinophagaceae bacterium]
MLLIYCDQTSARLQYILAALFNQIISVSYRVTSDVTEFQQYSSVKINYSHQKFSDNELWIQPQNLLFEKNIQQHQIECFEWNELKYFFKTNGDIPFDVFAASFYLITRYEEYLPHKLDEYGRYAHKNSLAFKEKFLHLPLINLWMKELIKILQIKFQNLQIFKFSNFNFIPTYDIDIAYAYKGKGIVRNVAALFWAMMKGEWTMAKERIQVLNKTKKDPFDVFNWLEDLHAKHQLNPVYFFLLAEDKKRFDKNISSHDKNLHQLINEISQKYKVGIHPSWQSGDDKNILKKEIQLLKNIIGKPITASRQHYIRMKFPETYRLLIDEKISKDFSMGYGSINGFRASVASSFYWYDLEKEQQTSLLIHPFCFMEANSFFEQHYSATQAATELQQYYEIVKNVSGELITIFHNHFITEQPQWIEWRKLYENFLCDNC